MKIDIQIFEDAGGRRPAISLEALAWLQDNVQPMVDALPNGFGQDIEPWCAADARDCMENWCEMVGRRAAALAPYRPEGDCGWFEALGVRTPEPAVAPSP